MALSLPVESVDTLRLPGLLKHRVYRASGIGSGGKEMTGLSLSYPYGFSSIRPFAMTRPNAVVSRPVHCSSDCTTCTLSLQS